MKVFICILLLSSNLFVNSQIIVGDITIKPTFKVLDKDLILNGAGLREKFFIDLYVIALYLKCRSQDGIKLMNANEAMVIKLHIVSSLISSEKFKKTTADGFNRVTHGNTKPIQFEIDQFLSVFQDKINKNDVYDFVYDPLKGTLIYRNNKLVTTIIGLEFKKALFGLWLYEKAADTDIHDELLGIK